VSDVHCCDVLNVADYLSNIYTFDTDRPTDPLIIKRHTIVCVIIAGIAGTGFLE